MKRQKILTKDDIAKKLVADGFNNFYAKLGLQTENLSSLGSYNLGNLLSRNRDILEAIYRTSWIAGQVIDSISEDMTKEGIYMYSDMSPDHVKELQSKITEFGLWQVICDGIKWSRLYGGSIIVFLNKGAKFEEPLDIERIGKDSFKGAYTLDRWQITPSLGDLIGEFGPDMGLPRYYTVLPSSDQMMGFKIHHSRVIRLEGIGMPFFQKKYDNTWGMSVLERMYDRLIAFDSATQGAAQLLYKAYLRTVCIDGLREALSMGGQVEQAVIKQFQYIRLMQSIEGITLLDSKDTFQTHQYSFSGVSDVLMQFGQQISGATGIPLVRLFGQSPAGLSATGESDLRNYYDNINKLQESRLRRGIRTLLEIMSMSLFGKSLPEDFEFEFASLWEMSDNEKSTIASSNTQAVSTAYQAGLITKKIGMRELSQQSKVSGIFTTITNEDIKKAKEDLPPDMEDTGGMEIPDIKEEGEDDFNIEETENLINKKKSLKDLLKELKEINIEKEQDNTKKSLENLTKELNELTTIESLEEDVKNLTGYNNIEDLEEQLKALKNYSKEKEVESSVDRDNQIKKLEKDLKRIKTFDKKGIFKRIGNLFKTKDTLEATSYQGIPIVIENPIGSIRKWKDKNGKQGKTKMFYSYGYIRNTEGADKDEVDVFIGNSAYAGNVYIIQHMKEKNYDEDKVFLGFDNKTQARDAFLAHYQDYTHIGKIHTLPILRFKEKIFNKAQEGKPITEDEKNRAPKGGITLKGKEFKGGEFIPKEGGYAKEFEERKAKKKEAPSKSNKLIRKGINKEPQTKSEESLYNNLMGMNKFIISRTGIKDYKYKGMYDLVLKEGSFFIPPEKNKPRPEGMIKGKDKDCYANAARLALDNSNYTYVEGIATPDFIELPIQHAWCIDNKDNVIDPTWKTAGSVYYGVPFNTEFLRETILKTEIWGLIPEYYRKDYNPFKEGYSKKAIKTFNRITDAKPKLKEEEKWVTVQGKGGKSRKILLGKGGIIKGGDIPKEIHGAKIGSKEMKEKLEEIEFDSKEKKKREKIYIDYPDPGRTKKEKDFLDTKRLPSKKVKNKKGELVEKIGELVLSNGKPLPKHINVAIAPAWQWVRVNPDPKGDLLVTGIDQKGNRQPKYSKEHDRTQDIKKFGKVKQLNKDLQNIVNKTEKEFNSSNSVTKDSAVCLRLIQLTGARADSDTSVGDIKSYGASTLEGRHIKFNKDNSIVIDFIGKKGKQNIYSITDKKLIKELLERRNVGKDEKLFNIGYSDLLSFTKKISKDKYVPKLFRTRIACEVAAESIKKIKDPINSKEYKKAVAAVGDIVAERLCNTRTVALNKYIDPSLFNDWRKKSGIKDRI